MVLIIFKDLMRLLSLNGNVNTVIRKVKVKDFLLDGMEIIAKKIRSPDQYSTSEYDAGEKVIRKVDPNDILLISEEYVNDYTMTDKEY